MNKNFNYDSRCPLCLAKEPHTKSEHYREMKAWWKKGSLSIVPHVTQKRGD